MILHSPDRDRTLLPQWALSRQHCDHCWQKATCQDGDDVLCEWHYRLRQWITSVIQGKWFMEHGNIEGFVSQWNEQIVPNMVKMWDVTKPFVPEERRQS